MKKIFDVSLVTIVFLIFLTSLFLTRVTVQGESMYPTYHSGDEVWVLKRQEYVKDDVIVFDNPYGLTEPLSIFGYKIPAIKMPVRYMKRIVAEPGDVVEVKGDNVKVNNKIINQGQSSLEQPTYIYNLAEGEYFVLGDNRINSKDSRSYGIVKENLIYAKVIKERFNRWKF